jgi:HSP20 family protein
MKTKGKDIVSTTPTVTRELTPFEEMDRLFETLFHRRWFAPFHTMFPEWPHFGERAYDLRMPRVDVIDQDPDILVRAELPGVEKADLNVNLTGQTLTIEGETHHEEKEGKGEYYRSEITRGKFSRTIRLPEEVDETQTKAEFKDGMLEVHLPKAHKVERRKIEIE